MSKIPSRGRSDINHTFTNREPQWLCLITNMVFPCSISLLVWTSSTGVTVWLSSFDYCAIHALSTSQFWSLDILPLPIWWAVLCLYVLFCLRVMCSSQVQLVDFARYSLALFLFTINCPWLGWLTGPGSQELLGWGQTIEAVNRRKVEAPHPRGWLPLAAGTDPSFLTDAHPAGESSLNSMPECGIVAY